SPVCPKCGSPDYEKRGRHRMCRTCLTRYTPPTSFLERAVFAAVFIIPGLLLCVPGGAAVVSLLTGGPAAVPAGCFALSAIPGLLGLLCVGWGIKELVGGPRPGHHGSRQPDEPVDSDCEETIPDCDVTVPPEQAEALVREMAERHGAKGVLRRLGCFRADHLANAAARFAYDLDATETPLAVIDTSLLRNGKAGLLLTNRRLYSSFHRRAIPLTEIDDVSLQDPSGQALLSFFLIVLLAAVCPPIGTLVILYFFLSGGLRQVQYRLVVNGEVVYAGGNPIRHRFWIELLPALARAARRQPDPAPSAGTPDSTEVTRHLGLLADSPPSPTARTPGGLVVKVVETAPHSLAGEQMAVDYLDDPTWEQIEARIRQLNRHGQPLLRLWTGDPGQSSALEIIGGHGNYVLRECGDGWVYYDSTRGEEEVEVQTSGEGYRCPAYYVCHDLGHVLQIARRFCETGIAGE
ncbi:MAG TPA: hypothetical protein VKA46_13845, partial [Gemmataceae bacterium]|nr:hypothetical protein [Gemmataceae bacterium]